MFEWISVKLKDLSIRQRVCINSTVYTIHIAFIFRAQARMLIFSSPANVPELASVMDN